MCPSKGVSAIVLTACSPHVAASIKIVFEPQPTPKAIASLAGTNIVAIAAGHNHALAVDDTGFAYAWGNGGAPVLQHPGVFMQADSDLSRRSFWPTALALRKVLLPTCLQGMAASARTCSRMSMRRSGWMRSRSV